MRHGAPTFVAARKRKSPIDPAKVELPPYCPDHPTVRDEVANYLDAVQLLDDQVGALLDKMKQGNLLDSDSFFGDNGRRQPRRRAVRREHHRECG